MIIAHKCPHCGLTYNTYLYWQCPSEACRARRKSTKEQPK